ncbi:hypothetical protein NX722_00685 [Endozoicomonas gorgoniicola]|uniref:Uncharacterized protein n=1 Tax=Endozoicomonas gorgoniicola TaxID=1234144 RepID=A0ABT3MPA0_9GAMM|nr:hypothetical protein [Endozoicomonas gorgoniicola]MCW7551198.1 hypothetical protein [Endozoicomonas gorgoniicola]
MPELSTARRIDDRKMHPASPKLKEYSCIGSSGWLEKLYIPLVLTFHIINPEKPSPLFGAFTGWLMENEGLQQK